jgi:hypothetical protein
VHRTGTLCQAAAFHYRQEQPYISQVEAHNYLF